MKTKILFTLLCLCLGLNFIFAQDLKFNWSDKEVVLDEKDGLFERFVGSNSKYVYAKLYKDATFIGSIQNDKVSICNLKIAAFDKKTMNRAFTAILFEKKTGDASLDEQMKKLFYYKTIVFEDNVYVFYKRLTELGKMDELFVQKFDKELNLVQGLKKINEQASAKVDFKKAEFFVLDNKKLGEKILIGSELPSDGMNGVELEYRLLNNDLSFVAANTVTLPIRVPFHVNQLTSSYRLGDDGNLYISSNVSIDDESVKTLQQGEPTYYTIFSILDLASGAIKSFPLRFENKTVTSFDFITQDNAVKIIGFFTDRTLDNGMEAEGSDTHGIFSVIIDNKNFTVTGTNFVYFTEDQQYELFKEYNWDSKTEKIITSSKVKQTEKWVHKLNFQIENMQVTPDNNIVLFCSRELNLNKDDPNNRQYHRRHSSLEMNVYKKDIAVFKLDKTANIIWCSNIIRDYCFKMVKIVYAYDINVVNRGNKYYILYGSNYQFNPQKMSCSGKMDDSNPPEVVYSVVLHINTGDYERKEYVLNNPDDKKPVRKGILADRIQVFDNEMYSNSTIRGNSYMVWITP